MATWPLARKWVLALVSLTAIAIGIATYAWHTAASDRASAWVDACSSVRLPAGDSSANWIPVTDQSPQGMLRLLSAEPSFARSPNGPLTPSLPVLSHPFHIHTGSDYNDCPHWLLPERDALGHLAAIVDYVYDYPHGRVRFASTGMILPDDPRYAAPFPYLSATQAVTIVKAVRHVAARSEPAPELVFLPIDVGVPERPGPGASWHGGGVVPSDPIWLIAGVDGQNYFVGTDRHVYTLRDIPVS